MTLLIDLNAPEFMQDTALAADLGDALPGVEIVTGPRTEPRADVIMAVTSAGRPQFARNLPGLRLVQKLGAGVDGVLRDCALPPHVMVARLESAAQALEISEYVLGAVLMWQRGFLAQARGARWAPEPPRSAAQCPVTVLGLGRIGSVVARELVARGYPVRGWARSHKQVEGVICLAGQGALAEAVSGAAFVVSVLPSTDQTRGLFDAAGLALLGAHTVLINVGRGDLVDVAALDRALEARVLRGAVLDVMPREPWPEDDALWRRPEVLITPHVSGWAVEDGLWIVAENYRRLRDGRAPLSLVSREMGY